jgi:hypothetical protein
MVNQILDKFPDRRLLSMRGKEGRKMITGVRKERFGDKADRASGALDIQEQMADGRHQ